MQNDDGDGRAREGGALTWEIRDGDCLNLMAEMEPASVDAVVTDPPYGLSFMGKAWDHGVPGKPFWAEALRVAKPGAHLLAFGGTRTFHRLTCAIEDVGWEIRDCLCWLYGSGFPKSLDVSKAIDKAAGAKREVVGRYQPPGMDKPWGLKKAADERGINIFASSRNNLDITGPATDAAREWSGWGTALKPAFEPIILARKPLAGTVAANVIAHGTGAINVDGCRIEHGEECRMMAASQANIDRPSEKLRQGGRRKPVLEIKPEGRWPANVCLDEEVAAQLDAQSGERSSGARSTTALRGSEKAGRIYNKGWAGDGTHAYPADVPASGGGASRFFYTAKASSGERHYAGRNQHPTVKPVNLMRWLCRLVTPPGGLILDPFCGSGSTGIAALSEGFRFIGMELDAEHVAVAKRRIAGPLFVDD